MGGRGINFSRLPIHKKKSDRIFLYDTWTLGIYTPPLFLFLNFLTKSHRDLFIKILLWYSEDSFLICPSVCFSIYLVFPFCQLLCCYGQYVLICFIYTVTFLLDVLIFTSTALKTSNWDKKNLNLRNLYGCKLKLLSDCILICLNSNLNSLAARTSISDSYLD